MTDNREVANTPNRTQRLLVSRNCRGIGELHSLGGDAVAAYPPGKVRHGIEEPIGAPVIGNEDSIQNCIVIVISADVF